MLLGPTNLLGPDALLGPEGGIALTAEPLLARVRIDVFGGSPGTPLYVLRRTSTTTELVRATIDGSVVWPDTSSYTLYDYEAPQGELVDYIVTDPDGVPIVADSIQLPLWGTWLKSPGRPSRNVRVYYGTDRSVSRAARRELIDIEGAARRVALSEVRGEPIGEAVLITRTRAQADALLLIMSDGLTLLLDTPPSWGVPFRYISAGDVEESRPLEVDKLNLQAEARAWTLSDVVEVDAPFGPPIEDVGRTYNDLPTLFGSYVAIPASVSTYEALAVGGE